MTIKFHETIVDYFTYVEQLNRTWNQIIDDLVRPIASLKNQSEQLQHVNSYTVDNAEICQILCARERLIFKINAGIDDEIARITHAVQTFNNLYQELKNKFNSLTILKSEIFVNDPLMVDLIMGTGSRPQLSSLLESVTQIREYYSNFYNTINNSYIALNRNDDQTIEMLALSLEANNIGQSKLMKSLAITQFFINYITI